MKHDGPPDAWRSRWEAAQHHGLNTLATAAGRDLAAAVDASVVDELADCPALLEFAALSTGEDSDDDESFDEWPGSAQPPSAGASAAHLRLAQAWQASVREAVEEVAREDQAGRTMGQHDLAAGSAGGPGGGAAGATAPPPPVGLPPARPPILAPSSPPRDVVGGVSLAAAVSPAVRGVGGGSVIPPRFALAGSLQRAFEAWQRGRERVRVFGRWAAEAEYEPCIGEHRHLGVPIFDLRGETPVLVPSLSRPTSQLRLKAWAAELEDFAEDPSLLHCLEFGFPSRSSCTPTSVWAKNWPSASGEHEEVMSAGIAEERGLTGPHLGARSPPILAYPHLPSRLSREESGRRTRPGQRVPCTPPSHVGPLVPPRPFG